MQPEEAKSVCEAQYLGVERESVTSGVIPDVVGIGLGKWKIRDMVPQDVAIKFYVTEKLYRSW